jgi:hypothetical protein
MAVGVASWATPRVAGRTFGLDAATNPQSPYLARLFGARDLAPAVGALMTEGDAQRQWIAIGAACDVADAIAGIAGGRAGYLDKATTFFVTATAVTAAVMGAAALRQS